MQPKDPDQQKSTNPSVGYERRLAAIKIQLHSQLPIDVRHGIEQAAKLLQDDPSNRELYRLLFEVAKEIPSQRDEIKKLFEKMVHDGSKQAEEALDDLRKISISTRPKAKSSDDTTQVSDDRKQTLLDDADDAYYSAEFEKSITLYRRVLQQEPENRRAQQQLEKAELNRIAAQRPDRKLPREAMQNYRRARSFIAARDISSAIGMLNAAIEEAQANGLRFQEAEELLGSQLSLQIAAEYKEQANKLVQDEKWGDALEKYEQLLKLDQADDTSRLIYEKLEELTRSEAILVTLADSLDDESNRKEKLGIIASSIKAGESIIKLTNTNRFKVIRAKYGLYKAESDLHKWMAFTALAPQGRLVSILRAATNILSPEDPALKYIEGQLKRFKPVRIVFYISIILIIVFILFQLLSGNFGNTPPVVSYTLSPTLTPSITLALPATKTPIPSKTVTPTIANTETIAPTSTVTNTPTAILLDNGYINVLLIHPQDQPNGRWIGELTRFQVVTILEQKVVSGDQWYFVQWEVNGVTQEGWVLARFITIGSPPILKSPTP